MVNYKFFNRNGKLYIRINRGEANSKYVKSTGLDIGSLEIKQVTVDREIHIRGRACRVDGYTRPAIEANELIERIDIKMKDAAGPEDAIAIAEKQFSVEVEEDSSFTRFYLEALGEKRKDLSDNTVTSYESVLRKYKDFMDGKDFDVYAVNILGVEPRLRRPRIVEMQRLWEAFDNYLIHEEGLSKGSRALYFSKLKSIQSWVEDNHGVRFWCGHKVATPDYSMKKIEWPMDVVTELLLSEDKGYVPAFQLQLWSTLRVGDLLQLKEKNFREVDGVWRLRMVNQKTGSSVSPVIPEGVAYRCLANIWKYGSVCPTKRPSKAQYGRKLKAFFKKKFPDRMVSTFNDDNEVVDLHLWKTARSHQLRKQGINLYLNNDFSSKTVTQFFSGHANEKAFNEHYVFKLGEAELSAVAEFQAELIKSNLKRNEAPDY